MSATKHATKLVLGVLTAALAVGLTLAAMFVLVSATLSIAQMTSPVVRALAVAAELVLGVILLVGTVYVSTHLAVRIFGDDTRG
jgi:hypothetical protein